MGRQLQERRAATGDEYCAIRLGPETPGDQRRDDALSARARTHGTEDVARDGIVTRTETYGERWSDATDFHLTGRFEAHENDELISARDVAETVPRDHL